MSHHLVTVCMFCLLCAAHTCGSHIDIQNNGILTYDPSIEPEHTIVNLEEKRRLDSKARYHQKLQKIRHKERSKRELKSLNPNTYYVEQIFRLYGDAQSMTMNLTGFNRMLEKLDLHKLIEGGSETTDNIGYIGQIGAKQDVINCVSSAELITTVNTRLKPHEHDHDHDHTHEDHDAEVLSKDTLQNICPILLYQKLANTSIEQLGCVKEKNLPSIRVDGRDLKRADEAEGKNMYAVWLYSSLSIAAISACGLLGVAVIPIMHKTYYNHLLQFLVALAVGTLCGDALLHLMPHAMSPIEHEDTAITVHSHDDGMWKGLAAMLGVVFFYFTEKGLTVVVEWRKRRQKLEEDKLPSRVRVFKDDTAGGCSGGSKAPITNSTSNSLLKIFKRDDKGDPTTMTCKHKYSGYPYCYDEIDTDTHDDHHLRDGQIPPSPKANKNHNNSVSVVSSNALNSEAKENEPTAKDWLLKAETTPAVVEMNNIKHKEEGAKDLKDGDSYTVILREHSRAHHGHSHAHGHVHAPPSSMSSVAWMVIMGDGLHNFTDGMAIGAAFASNLAGGFSTAIAVLCHELPHELGDFAVLLKAGMSVKRAVCYNVLSSALCLAGMVCGVVAGDTPSATRWLFAIAAGTFLYIALVDMMPELSTSHSNEGTLCQCILQLMGLASGIGIMLVIAMYEHDLKNLFG
ncbi:zinc transporter foi [Galleria mellonella]|uniref:Zinc transporter foi n=1 Tax=Galleria mellonella TaxID=7137 RepID=A0ABM3N096_GALME|nr:zinc transporter foi [Galleria mellonella]XP_052757017.1 zinc transporter foi [Galleria mellonella]XP_052757018.1 zinc transporter foi [Galleria mellonella]XP_052757019.1 zinc transporter foi [Galleria mellonella]XP_052757021.1 zinc transporter foi [Galleria mellonella]